MRFKIWQGAVILVAAAVLLVAGFVNYEPFKDEPSIGAGYVPPIANTCPQSALAVIGKYEGIRRNEVYECESKTFDLGDEQMDFVLIRYAGESLDCYDGCIFSNYCTIVEGDGTEYPYETQAYHRDEAVLMTQQSDTLDAKPCTSSEDCTEALTGRDHPLTETDAFINFVRDEIVGGSFPSTSSFRRCG